MTSGLFVDLFAKLFDYIFNNWDQQLGADWRLGTARRPLVAPGP